MNIYKFLLCPQYKQVVLPPFCVGLPRSSEKCNAALPVATFNWSVWVSISWIIHLDSFTSRDKIICPVTVYILPLFTTAVVSLQVYYSMHIRFIRVWDLQYPEDQISMRHTRFQSYLYPTLIHDKIVHLCLLCNKTTAKQLNLTTWYAGVLFNPFWVPNSLFWYSLVQ